MTEPRPDVATLTVVTEDALIFRFVQPGHIDATARVGSQLQTSALQTNEFTPNDHSYGPSVYVGSKLKRGVDDLFAACEKWKGWRYARVPVDQVNAIGVTVVLSPQDCELESIRHAHASLIGVTKPHRSKLLRLIEKHLV
jgi:hypothetical protein